MWSREAVPAGRAHEARFEGTPGVDSKYRKKVLTGEVALRVRDLIRQIAMEHEITILWGKVASDHIHVLVAYRPHVDVSLQWLKGISSRILLEEFAHLRKAFWGRYLWATGYLAVSAGNLTDEMVREYMVREYIEQQEGEPVHDDSRFVIDNPEKLPTSRQ
jgi:putative transposase